MNTDKQIKERENKMNTDKQIKEMAEAIFSTCNCGLFEDEAYRIAEFVIEGLGYRKAEDTAKKIFNDIENVLTTDVYDFESGKWDLHFDFDELNKVKQKHCNEIFFVKMTHTCPHNIPDLVTSISDTAYRHPLTESQYTLEQIRRNGVERRLRKGRK